MRDPADKVTLQIPDLTPVRRGRPPTGNAMTPAERQRASRAKRQAETFESFTARQISMMLGARAAQALDMLTYKSDKSQKDVIEELLIAAYEAEKALL